MFDRLPGRTTRTSRTFITSRTVSHMEFNFEKLEVWQLAMDVIDEVYSLLDNYPEGEKYALIPQAKRSVCSVALNIAEGSVRGKRESNQYIRIALGSLIETITNLKRLLQNCLSSPNVSIPDTSIRGRIWFFKQLEPDSRSESLRE